MPVTVQNSQVKKVLVAMSGGVDSSVTALLLQQAGYQVIGITMHLWSGDSCEPSQKSCCSADQIEDARKVARKLGFPHYTLDVRELFEQQVIQFFEQEYLRGRTPNPCIICNETLKFDYLLSQAKQFGCAFMATGHYSRIETIEGEARGGEQQVFLKKGLDEHKDQSYFLCRFTQEQLQKTLFPLGSYTKPEVRVLAEKAGLVTAHKAESQEICFIPDDDYRGYIKKRYPDRIKPGKIVNKAGAVLGEHPGYPFFTIGQRRKLGVALGKPQYVLSLDPQKNIVVIGDKKDLEKQRVLISEVNWISGEIPASPLPVSARLRYRQQEQPALITPLSKRRALLVFNEAQAGVTPGQALAFYQGDILLGGGWIEGEKE